jgi:hypothetical protein
MPLDALQQQLNFHPQIIKIDVEGFELEVLFGLSEAIDYLSFEYAMPERKKTIPQCIDRIVEISNQHHVHFNYSMGESMEWALAEWVTAQEMKEEIENSRFMNSRFGDIYAKAALAGKL